MYWNCHSHFSLGYGTLSVNELFNEAKKNKVRKLALTDINNTSAYIELLRICQERRDEWELSVILGIEFRQDNHLLYIGLARNNEGFEELNRYLSFHNRTSKPLRKKAPPFGHVFVIYPLNNAPERLRENEWIGIRIEEQNKILQIREKAKREKLVAWHPVTFKHKQGFNIHRLQRAISLNTLLSLLPETEQAVPNEIMGPESRLNKLFSSHTQLLRNNRYLLENCHTHVELGTSKNKKHFLASKYEDRELLLKLASEGFDKRYGDLKSTEIIRRFEKELEVIEKKNFEAYYLIAQDIIQFADRQGFAHVGRGSGANSIIAFCLGITDVDPIELDLYFERFLNTERTSPPDFDIDFSWKDRDQVTQYIFDRFGNEHVSLLGTHSTFQERSTIRELGKVFGLPKEEIDKLIKYPQQRYKDEITSLIFRYAELMREMPQHLSIHAGGVLITEQPIYAYTALDLPPKGFPVTHFEMHNAEDLGIYKLDILSQRGLGHIKDTALLIEKNQGIKVDVNRFPAFKKDAKIKKLLQDGNCMGCFYVESPATRMLLGKLKCDDYITLVAASSIIRPGVARSGMMRAYIERHHATRNGRPYESIHPKMDEIMQETYGVMVYQEDVIKVAHHFAGLTLTEADVLRRGMSGKYRSRKEFQRVQDRFFQNCKQLGYEDRVTQRVWFEIESFAGYSFAKGHSASFAVESYQSLFLKAHYPLEFMVGVINNFGGFYRTEFYFHEAKKWGACIVPPCVNNSEYFTSIMGKTIHIGFIHLKDLEKGVVDSLLADRKTNGPFADLDDFIKRVRISLEQIRILLRIGAFGFTGMNKKQLLWQAQLHYGQKSQKKLIGMDLFEEPSISYKLPKLHENPYEDAFDEIDLLGFPLCNPFDLLEKGNFQTIKAKELLSKLHQDIEIIGYLVTTKDASTSKGQRMHFGTFYDCKGDIFDTVNFPPVARRHPFQGAGFYRMLGTVVEDFGYPMVEVKKMLKLPMKSRWKTGVKGAGKLEKNEVI